MDPRQEGRAPALEPRHGLSRLPPGASSKHSIPATAQEEASAIQRAKQLHVHQPGIVLVPGARLQVQETIDNNWYDCKVIEVDWGELDILIHYQGWSDKFDTWLKMDSKRIRPAPAAKSKDHCPFRVGDNVLAYWAPDQQKYPAKVTRVINNQQCEVLFQDNISKVLACSKMTKYAGRLPAIPDFVLVSSAAALTSATASAVSGTRSTATAAAAAAAAQKASSTNPADASKKSIFEVEICEQKRKPKRKAEYVELFDNIKRRKSIHGTGSSTPMKSDQSPPSSSTASPSLRSGTRLSLPSPVTVTPHTTPLRSSAASITRAAAIHTPSRPSNTPHRTSTTDVTSKPSATNTPSRTTVVPSSSVACLTATSLRSVAHKTHQSQITATAADDDSEGPKTRTRAGSEQRRRRESGSSTVSNASSTSSNRVVIDSIDITTPEKCPSKKAAANQSSLAAVSASDTQPKIDTTAASTTSTEASISTTNLSPVSTSLPSTTMSSVVTTTSSVSKDDDEPIRVLGPFARFSNGSGTPGQHLKKTAKKPPTKHVLPTKLGLLVGLSATRPAPMSDDCMLGWEKHGCNVLSQNTFPGWVKQFTRRLPYTGQDSWDVAYFAPDGSTIRNKRDLSSYAEENTLPCLVASFDFSPRGVKEMMLDHMKTCSVGTARGGVSRTVVVSSTNPQLYPSTSTTTTTPQTSTKETRSMQLRKVRIGQDDQPKQDVQLHETPKRSSHHSEQPSMQTEQPSTVHKPRESRPTEELQHLSQKSPKKLQPHTPPSKYSHHKTHLATQSIPTGGYRQREDGARGFGNVEDHPFADEDDDAGVCSSNAEEDEDESEVVSPDVRKRKAAAAIAKAESSVGLDSKTFYKCSRGQSSSVVDSAASSEITSFSASQIKHTPVVVAATPSTSQVSSGSSSHPGRIKIEIPINPDVSRVAETRDLDRQKPEGSVSRTPIRHKTTRRDPVTPNDFGVTGLEEHECTVKDCGKTFRKLSLLQMHEKHYHPTTISRTGQPAPNVADLAYARTVGGHNLLSSPITPAQQSRYLQEKRSKRHSIGELSETKRRRLDKELSKESIRRKSTPVGEILDELDVLSGDQDESNDVRPVTEDEATNKDDSEYIVSKEFSADEGGSDMLGNKERRPSMGDKKMGTDVETKSLLLDESDSDSEDDFMGFPVVPTPKSETSSAGVATIAQKTAVVVAAAPAVTASIATSVSAVAADDTVTSADADDTDVADVTTDVPEEEGTSGHDIINCCCGSMEEEGLMLQCDVCQCWQHAACYAIDQENDVPEKYVCSMCARPRLVRSQHTADHLVTNWLNEAQLPQFSFSKAVANSKVKHCIRKSHELSKSLFGHSQVLHSLSRTLAIAQTTDHPKFVMWHKQWPDPRPAGCKRSETYTDQTTSWLPPHSTTPSFSQNQPYNQNPVFSQSQVFSQSLIPTADLSFTNSLNLVGNSVFSNAPPVLSSQSGLPSLNTSLNQEDENLLQHIMNFEPLLQSEPSTSGVGGFTTSAMTTIPTSSMMASPQQQMPHLSTAAETPVSFSNPVSIATTSINIVSAGAGATEMKVNDTTSEAYTPISECSTSITRSLDKTNLLGNNSMDMDPEKVQKDSSSATVTAIETHLTGAPSTSKINESYPGDSIQSSGNAQEIAVLEPMEVDGLEDSKMNQETDADKITEKEDNMKSINNVSPQPTVAVSQTTSLDGTESRGQNNREKSDQIEDCNSRDDDNSIDEKKDSQGNTSPNANQIKTKPQPNTDTSTVEEKSDCRDSPLLDISPIKSLFSSDESFGPNSSVQLDSTSTKKTLEKSESSLHLHLSFSDESDKETTEPNDTLPTGQNSSTSSDLSPLQQKSKLDSKECEGNIRSSSPVEKPEGALSVIPVLKKKLNEEVKPCTSGEISESAKGTGTDVAQTSNDAVTGSTKSMHQQLGDITKNEDTNELSVVSTTDDINNLRESEGISDIGDSDNMANLDDAGAMTGLGEGTGFCAIGDAMTVSKPTNSSSENSSDFSTGGHLAHPFTSTTNPSLAEANGNLSEANSNLSAANVNAADISQDSIMIGHNSQSHLEGAENLDADLDASDLGLDLHELLTSNPSLDQLVMPALAAGPSSTDLQPLLPGECGAVSFPEAERIEPVKCRLNLLHHVQAVQDTLEHAYDAIEDQLRKLEEEVGLPELTDDEDETCQDASSRQMVQMVLADMAVVQKLAHLTG